MKLCALMLLAVLPAAFADEAANAVALGRRARSDGLPQAAIHDLKRAASKKNASADAAVVVELARCLIESDRETEAVEWLTKSPHRNEASIIFWRAQAYAQEGDFEKALADYMRAGKMDSPMRSEAEFGRARMLEALGRADEALEAYLRISTASPWRSAAELASAGLLIRQGRRDEAASLLDKFQPKTAEDRDVQRYLQGRLALENDKAGVAGRIFEKLSPRDPRLAAGGVIGSADALQRSDESEKAEALLESFVRDNPDSPLLDEVLAKLDEIRAGEKSPSNATLKLWEKDEDHPALSAAASFYLARSDERQDRRDRAIRNYEEFIADHPESPLRTAAIIRLAALYIDEKNPGEALDILSQSGAVEDRATRARMLFLQAAAEYAKGNFPSASRTFVRATNLDPSLSEPALADAALSAIGAGNEPQVAEILNALRKENAQAARRIELAQAFQAARQGNPDAAEQLTWLASGGGAVGNRARLALAEWRWQNGDIMGASSEFRRVANSKAAGGGDQKDYFAVYLADDGSRGAMNAVSEAAREFLAAHPDSAREAEVRMKWGEVLMRGGDYRGARVQFEKAAGIAGDPSLKQSAWFLAARAAIGSMNPAEIDAAIDMLEKVAEEKNEPLASQARIEQAMLQSALGRTNDAVAILDSLAETSKDPRMRLAARMKKGEALMQLGAHDKPQIKSAIKEWQAVAKDREASPAERNEALTRAAAASALAGDTDAAIADYYEVLTASRDAQPEYFWYYKAGFDAAKLLHEAQRYREEVAIYEKMAAVPGPRAEEAREQVKRLRLENFIWNN